ncbi:MAG TPA: hypothetical protein VEH86_07025 [Candidatus Acidoferrum sp.]|nr:hypothetical protein [Candidatus Acidoferrum sp.]
MQDRIETRNSGINYLAFGSIIFGWGILLVLMQVGIIDNNVSTWPFAFAAFGAWLIVSGVVKLNRTRSMKPE